MLHILLDIGANAYLIDVKVAKDIELQYITIAR